MEVKLISAPDYLYFKQVNVDMRIFVQSKKNKIKALNQIKL